MTSGCSADEATLAILDRAAEGGINFIDTADVYPLGGAGDTGADRGDPRRLAARQAGPLRRRDQVLRADRAGALGRGQLAQAHSLCGRGLAAPSADRLHRPLPAARLRPRTPIDETLGALDDLVTRQGPLRRLLQLPGLPAGAGGRPGERGLARFDSVQPRYNLLFRQIERELLPFCAEEGVGVIPYNPIAGGLLSGKHDRARRPPEGSRFTLGTAGPIYQDRYWHDREFDTVEQLRQLADEAGRAASSPWRSPGYWPTRPITAPIIGASRPDQLDAQPRRGRPRDRRRPQGRLDELTHDYRLGDAAR